MQKRTLKEKIRIALTFGGDSVPTVKRLDEIERILDEDDKDGDDDESEN